MPFFIFIFFFRNQLRDRNGPFRFCVSVYNILGKYTIILYIYYTPSYVTAIGQKSPAARQHDNNNIIHKRTPGTLVYYKVRRAYM